MDFSLISNENDEPLSVLRGTNNKTAAADDCRVPKPDSDKPPTVTIDPAGDVVLFMQKSMKLVVSTKVLSLASEPFAAMFSDRYAEGQALKDGNRVIDLPEDDPIAMLRICCLLHHVYQYPPDSPVELLIVAVLAQKYICVTSINFALQAFLDKMVTEKLDLQRGAESQQKLDLTRLLMVAYILRNATSFRCISGEAAFHHSLRRPMLIDESVSEIVSPNVIMLVEYRKRSLSWKITQELRTAMRTRAHQSVVEPQCPITFDHLRIYGSCLSEVLDAIPYCILTLHDILLWLGHDMADQVKVQLADKDEEKACRAKAVLATKIVSTYDQDRSRYGLCLTCILDERWGAALNCEQDDHKEVAPRPTKRIKISTD